MRQEDRNNQAAVGRQTRVEVRTEPRTRRANEALREAALSPLEERALRMRFGVALGPDDALDELTGLSERGARQLAALEARAVARVTGRVDEARKQQIVERLRDGG